MANAAKTKIATMTAYDRLPSTTNGNPMYLCSFKDANGNEFEARTMPDCQSAYGITRGKDVAKEYSFKMWRGHLRVC